MRGMIIAFAVCLVLFSMPGFTGVNLIQSFERTVTGTGNFGWSVSQAGDANGDGYGDVIIGAPKYSSWTGRSYVYYGGSAMDNTADVTMTGETVNNYFGYSVYGAGDANGDGYDDVIVGAPGYSSGTGRAYVYYGGPAMNNTPDVTMAGETAGDQFGESVSGAVDVNNDGYDDVIVGAPGENSSATGLAYVYYGGPAMNNTADVTMAGETAEDHFGIYVSGAGDLDNDGYGDVIVGACGYGSNTGRAYIYFGASSMDNVAKVTMTGEAANNDFGEAVSGAGDVNNDGYDDVIVGTFMFGLDFGRAYLYYGGSSMNNVADVTFTGEAISDQFGISVSGVGDVNNDGYDDVMVSAGGYGASTGRAYLYYGAPSMHDVADIILTGETTGDGFGCVSGAGDANGDGYDDVIVGASGYSSSTGRAYIYFGASSMDDAADVTMTGEITSDHFGFSVSGAGDANGDGYDDVIIGTRQYDSGTGRANIYYGGSPMNNTSDVTLTGEATHNYFGYSVSGAGDVNDDGYDDVIVGANGYGSSAGRAYIYYGGSAMNNTADVTLTGETTGSQLGNSVSGAGRVNKDGYDDVIVGAPGYGSSTGRAYVYYGGSAMNNTADVTLTGEAAWNYFGVYVSGAGDVNSDEYDDVIIGACGYGSSTGRAYIYYGGLAMNDVVDVTLTGEAASNDFGASVSMAGDANGDGYDDVIVGALFYGPCTGRAYIYYGGSAMNDAADVTLTGEAADNLFGVSVYGAGDVNQDGYDDVIVGANGYSSNTGRGYVYYGGSAMDGAADATLTGEAADNNFGVSVSGAGDVNGDGIDDMIIGADGYNYNGSNGKAYIYSIFVQAKFKAWLEGPYQEGGSMTTALNTGRSIPLTSPYGDGRTVTAVPDGVTDWISLALRTSGTGSDVCQRSFFIRNDGSLVDVDGTTTDLKMPGMPDGSYYPLIRHRNHLAAMSESAVSLNNDPASLYNFTTDLRQYLGRDAKLLETGVYGLYAGDTNATGTVDANDRSAAWNDRNKTGYEPADCNLSGTVDANDRSTTWNNRNKTTSVP